MKDTLQLMKDIGGFGQLNEFDWLTGLYNRAATEAKVNDFLKSKRYGVLLVADIADFKSINDHFGHLAGDSVLQTTARILRDLTLMKDILGRVGGDEFVIFMPIRQEAEFVESRCRQMEQAFLNLPHPPVMTERLRLTVCGSYYQAGDTYESLYSRAYQSLLDKKISRKKKKADIGGGRSLKTDIEKISRELSEPGSPKGAYCQDYESFVTIYRFMERRLKRIQSSIYSILITLTDEQGNFPELAERKRLIEALGGIIQNSLRSGDVFTCYSSSQFLIMVCDATDIETDAIAARIQSKFGQQRCFDGCRISYQRYPLKPAFQNTRESQKE